MSQCLFSSSCLSTVADNYLDFGRPFQIPNDMWIQGKVAHLDAE